MNEQEKAIQDAVKLLANTVNAMGNNEFGITLSRAIQNEHRTLQQSIWRTIFSAIKDYSATATNDLRNAGSVTATKHLSKVIEDYPEDFYLPYI